VTARRSSPRTPMRPTSRALPVSGPPDRDSYSPVRCGCQARGDGGALTGRAKRLPAMPAAEHARFRASFCGAVVGALRGCWRSRAPSRPRRESSSPATIQAPIDPTLAASPSWCSRPAHRPICRTLRTTTPLAHARHAAIPFDTMRRCSRCPRSHPGDRFARRAVGSSGLGGGRQHWQGNPSARWSCPAKVLAARRAHDVAPSRQVTPASSPSAPALSRSRPVGWRPRPSATT